MATRPAGPAQPRSPGLDVSQVLGARARGATPAGLSSSSATDLLCVITGESFNLSWPQLTYLLQKGVVRLNYCQLFGDPGGKKVRFIQKSL